MDPVFRRLPDGRLNFVYTKSASAYKAKSWTAKPDSEVYKEAVEEVKQLNGNVDTVTDVLGQFILQFGKFQGVTFKWLCENALSYAAYIVDSLRSETRTLAPISQNKFRLKDYVTSFPEGREAVEMKKAEREAKTKPKPSTAALQHGHEKKSTVLTSTSGQSTTLSEESDMDDTVLLSEVQQLETIYAKDTGKNTQTTTKQLNPSRTEYPLPEGWRASLQESDRAWISKTFFKFNKHGHVEMDFAKVDKLWWYPPNPQLICSLVPRVERYFSHRLLMWMPRKLWKVNLTCPKPDCEDTRLTSAGLYKTVRHVLDINDVYLLATEYLECSKCRGRYAGWSTAVLQQLDLGHRLQFPVILTYRYACDMKVVRLMRQRGLGNSVTQLQKKLEEQHGEAYFTRCLQYYTDCSGFSSAKKSGLVQNVEFPKPPTQRPVPKYNWFATVYSFDVLQRADEMKAAITSTLGRVLKMDSTKKVTKKLAGYAKGTAAWATNVGNEYGQVLISVMTATEGSGLNDMAEGLMNRYRKAGENPPDLMYVDRGCCPDKQLRSLFWDWPNMIIRLDIWHFMRRLASCCTTESHPLYGIFMGHMSKCIYEVSKEDLKLLKEAKRNELVGKGIPSPTDEQVSQSLTKHELTIYCRRRTRGSVETERLLSELLESFCGEQGVDALGVPLFDIEKLRATWDSQKRHIPCIQDPEGYSLYTVVGTVIKGGVTLNKYRCARGSTSLESFHLHLNRFIPGPTINSVHMQAYLLDGLSRWNEDRAVAASTSIPTSTPLTYSGLLRTACNKVSNKVHGEKLLPAYNEPMKYTGELIGVEYLYNQTGQILQKFADLDLESTNQDLEDELDTGPESFEDEGVQDMYSLEDPTIPLEESMKKPTQISKPATTLSHPRKSSQVLVPPPKTPTQDTAPKPTTEPIQELLVAPTKKPTQISKPATTLSHPRKSSQVLVSPPKTPTQDTAPKPTTEPIQELLVAPTKKPTQISKPATTLSHPRKSSQVLVSPPKTPTQDTAPKPTTEPIQELLVAPTKKPTQISKPATTLSHPRKSSQVLVSPPKTPTQDTAPKPTTEPIQELLVAPTQETEIYMGPDNIPGMDKVENLARFLFSLKDEEAPLSNTQALQVISLWNDLQSYDRKPSKIVRRVTDKPSRGRFKSKKSSTSVIPGVEFTQRSFLGSGIPAQFPDANRYMESFINKLCAAHPAPEKSGGKVVQRWTLVTTEYKKVQEKIINNSKVMQETGLQLLEINNKTLGDWYNKKETKKEQKLLKQNIRLPEPSLSSETALPTPAPLPPLAAKQIPKSNQFIFKLPENTAGQFTSRQPRKIMKAAATYPNPESNLQTTVAPIEIQLPLFEKKIPRSTKWYRQHRADPGKTTKTYKRKTTGMTCKKCGCSRDDGLHKQYYGSWFCPTTSTEGYDEWMENIKQTKSIKRKRSEES